MNKEDTTTSNSSIKRYFRPKNIVYQVSDDSIDTTQSGSSRSRITHNQHLLGNYLLSQKRNKTFYLDKNNPIKIFFVDRGNSILAYDISIRSAESISALTQEKGWGRIKVSGTREFKQLMWLEANKRGIEVSGYRPSQQDDAALDLALKDNTSRSSFIKKNGSGHKLSPVDVRSSNPELASKVREFTLRNPPLNQEPNRTAFNKLVNDATERFLADGKTLTPKESVKSVSLGPVNRSLERDTTMER